MGIEAAINGLEKDPFAGLIAGLEAAWGRSGAEALAGQWLAAEEADFHWDARLDERLIGAVERLEDEEDEDEGEGDRVATIGYLRGRWFVGIAIVDGEGRVVDMPELRRFDSAWDAWGAFADAG